MKGSLKVITGCMFSGKTDELMRLVRRLLIAGNIVIIFKPNIDTRYDEEDEEGEKKNNKVYTHYGISLEAVPVPTYDPEKILEYLLDDTTVVVIDEVQFFDPPIVQVVKELLAKGIKVIVAGLKQDSDGKLFGSMDKLLIMADSIVSLTAVCDICGAEDATITYWRGEGGEKKGQVVVGGSKLYGAKCYRH
jgi:thymidine kinase